MPSLISKIVGIPEGSSGRRPQMLEFQGLNWNSLQAQNLVCFLPMWEPPGAPCLDLGPLGLVGQPTNILRTQDPYFGDVYVGDGVTRGYKIPHNDAINFGLGPSPFSLAFWFKTPAGWDTPVDCYLMTFDDPGQANFPGFAVSFDTGGTIACNTGNTSSPDGGHKTTTGFFDGKWHHLTFSHYPQGANAATSAQNVYYIDGKFNATAPTDANIGAVGPTVPLYIGTDDDGVSQPFGGGIDTSGCYFCDFRIYRTNLGATEAAQLWHPDTRWELYQPARKSIFLPAFIPPPPAFTDTDSASGSESLSSISVTLADSDAASELDAGIASANLVNYDYLLYSDSTPNLVISFWNSDSVSYSDTLTILSSIVSADSLSYSDSTYNILISSWGFDSSSGSEIGVISASFSAIDSVLGAESPESILSIVLVVSIDSGSTTESIPGIMATLILSTDSGSGVEVSGTYTAIQATVQTIDSGIATPYAAISATMSSIDISNEFEKWLVVNNLVNVIDIDSGVGSDGWGITVTTGPSSWPAAMYFGM